MPRWPYQTGETNIMIGAPAAIVIFEAAKTSISHLSSDKLKLTFESMVNDKELSICLDYGYCPSDLMIGSVSKAIEYSWAFHSLINLDEANNQTINKGKSLWKAHWNRNKKVFVPKDSMGQWNNEEKFWLFSVFGTGHYTEGSKYHWCWGIPHENTITELIGMFGSEDEFIQSLEEFLEKGAENVLGAIVPSTYYWHGNEHNLHAPKNSKVCLGFSRPLSTFRNRYDNHHFSIN